MPIFTLHNVTRYNTQDLEALCAYLEAYLLKKGRSVKSGTFFAYAGDVPYLLDLHVQYSNGKTVERGHISGRPVLKIPRPENLYDTPLEALAACGSRASGDKPRIPKDICEEIAQTLLSFYETDRGNTTPMFIRNTKHLTSSGARLVKDRILWGAAPVVHIENKPQGIQTKLDKKKLSERKKVTKAILRASWMVQSVSRGLTVLENVMKALEDAAPYMEPPETEVLEAFRELSNSYEKVRKLTQSGEST